MPTSALLDGKVKDFSIGFPVNCKLNEDCFFFMYPDRLEKNGDYEDAYDYRCGTMSYDKHSGTDIIVKHVPQLEKGIEVLAAADGIVYETRDSVPDRRIRTGEPIPTSLEAGNRIYINHADEWHTDYVHLMRNSIRVKKGDKVKKGQVIALMGLSGRSQLPHLHFSLYYKDKVVDPFVGLTSMYGCNTKEEPIWETHYPYKRTGIIRTGFADKAVTLDELWDGMYQEKTMPQNISALVAWSHFYGLIKGDIIQTKIFDPNASLFSDLSYTMEENMRLYSRSAGKTTEFKILTPGIWRSETSVKRGEEYVAKESNSFELIKIEAPVKNDKN